MKTYEPTVDELRDQGLVFYEVVAGSQSHGTNTPESDIDTRGYYHVPMKYQTGLGDVKNQSQDPVTDTEFYNLKRAFELLIKANPNQIELLWTPKDCIRGINKQIMDELMDNRGLFITKAAYESHFQYARAQIGKAKGRNKWVNNPKPKDPPTKFDFCWVIPMSSDDFYPLECNDLAFQIQEELVLQNKFPMRPVSLKSLDQDIWNLNNYHVAKVEHMENVYRLYDYNPKNCGDDPVPFYPKGVFRGKNEQLVCEHISKEDEWLHFSGFLIYNEQAYKKSHKDWKDYWSWVENRNDVRWLHQEKGLLDFDAKNMSHCVRLLMSSKNILEEGKPIVRFEGDQLDLLKNIKAGEVEYDEIMKNVNSLQKDIDVLLKKTDIPDCADFDKLNKLYVHLNQVAEKELVG